MTDEKDNENSETLALLRNLTRAEPVFLVLNLLIGANIALVRGLHVTVLNEKWSTSVETIPVGASLVFLCIFGLFLTAGVHLLRRSLIEIIYLDAFDKVRAQWKGSSEPTRKQLLDTGFVPRKLVFKKTNRESNSYYLVMHQKYKEEIQEQVGCFAVRSMYYRAPNFGLVVGRSRLNCRRCFEFSRWLCRSVDCVGIRSICMLRSFPALLSADYLCGF